MSYFVQLRTFLEVYRCKNISRAANNLSLSQPAATAHIQTMESLIGKQLFERKHRGVEPTVPAHDLAAQVASHIDAIEQKVASVRSRSNEVSGTLTIAGPAEYISYVGCAQLANLLQSGNIDLVIMPGNRETNYKAIELGTADLAITASLPDSKLFDYEVLDIERLILVAHRIIAEQGSKQNLKDKLSGPDWLNSLPVIAYDNQLPLIREYFDLVFKQSCRSRVIARCPDIRTLAGLVKTGVGYTVLPDYLCYDDIRSGMLLELGPKGPENHLYLAWRKGAMAHPRLNFARDVLMAFAFLNKYTQQEREH